MKASTDDVVRITSGQYEGEKGVVLKRTDDPKPVKVEVCHVDVVPPRRHFADSDLEIID